jgi:CBS domain containing-hemolysin-like protein
MTEAIIIIILTIVFSGLFSGLEMAFLSANKLHIELQNKKGTYPYNQLSYLVKNPARFIATILVGNNIALVVYGHYMHRALGPAFTWTTSEYLILFLQTLISTLLILFLAEYIPKALFRANSDKVLRFFAMPAYLFYFIFYLPVSFFTATSNFIIKHVLRKNIPDYTPAFDRIELDLYLRERLADKKDDEEDIDPELEIFKNALDFSARKAREFMIPRTEITAVEVDSDIAVMKEILIETGYSKVLVYKENIDKIIGYAHAFELFRKPKDIRSMLRPVSFIPESMTANEILDSFTRENRNIAVVIDEFGGTSGLVTLEDVVEEIFGDIEDEHDTEEFVEKKVGENEYIFSSRLEVDYINEEFDLDLPESDNYNTLGGLIFDAHESIPEKGDEIVVDRFKFTIRKVTDNRIEEVHLKLLSPD